MKTFKTHTGYIVKGTALVSVCIEVSNDLIELAHDIYRENAYADHVTQETKDKILADSLKDAERIKNPENIGYELWIFQRLDTKLTGECIGLLP